MASRRQLQSSHELSANSIDFALLQSEEEQIGIFLTAILTSYTVPFGSSE